ncbi:MAG: tRNA (guanosine(46)-N7)-methyltransferase TrmB [Myxococcota bacterium]|jgi:tRNA (guanine-N7-)-methyltransferase
MSRAIRREVDGEDWRLWPSEVSGADWTKIFAAPAAVSLQIHVDIGFGAGEFLIDLAQRHPDRAFVGIELGFDRVLKLTRRLSRTPIRNVRLIGTAAEWAVREAFEDASVESFWINFPDPWPKRHHRRRRLVTPRFVHELTQKLSPGGSLHVATDDSGYARVIDDVLTCARGLRNSHAPYGCRHERSLPTRTVFEREWRGQGCRCFYFHYLRACN